VPFVGGTHLASVGGTHLASVIKLFPFDSSDGPDNVVLFTLLGIWTAWLALAIPALIWLQLGAIFSRRRGRFVISFLVLAILGPAVSHLIGAWVFSWDPETEFPIELHQFVIAYSIELGLLAGVGLVLALLPRERADEG
jgi:MFS family permease